MGHAIGTVHGFALCVTVNHENPARASGVVGCVAPEDPLMQCCCKRQIIGSWGTIKVRQDRSAFLYLTLLRAILILLKE